MNFRRYELAIINRGFWPKNQIIGEALLQLAETARDHGKSVVIVTQSDGNLEEMVREFDRGSDILFQSYKSGSNSSSTLLFRIFDAVVYMLWTCWSLLLTRPKKVYISTDPPILPAFVVFLYSKIFRASYTYHLQDIHPEATNVIIKLNPVLLSCFKKIDGFTIRHATNIITITETMKNEIIARSERKSSIYLIDNPTVATCDFVGDKISGFVFSGNAGRLQRIPLLLKSIKKYKDQGGVLPFLFIGSGIYSDQIQSLSREYDNVIYEGLLDSNTANELTARYEWALLPIEDEVTKYAFPSKTSSYALCGLNILSICSSWTTVAQWVVGHNYGINVSPDIDNIVKAFFEIENGLTINSEKVEAGCFSIESFVQNIYKIMYGKEDIYL